MIAPNEQLRGIGKRLILQQQHWVDVAMRRNDRQLDRVLVESTCDPTRRWIRRQESVRIETQPGQSLE
jgi:hypothetical protein